MRCAGQAVLSFVKRNVFSLRSDYLKAPYPPGRVNRHLADWEIVHAPTRDLTPLERVLYRDSLAGRSLYPPFIAHRSLSHIFRLRSSGVLPPTPFCPLTILPIISRQDQWSSCRTARKPALLRQWLDPVLVACPVELESICGSPETWCI